jgi:group II intron reverse transcriptase/maturase
MLAREAPQMVFTTLAHHIDVELLREAYRLTRKGGAPGVDGQTAADYERNLEENLRSLLERLKSGTYRAPPVRRVEIPKGDGKSTRPIGIPTFEDTVLQRAVVMVLSAIYEQDFMDCSYGFRPGRSAHQALERLWQELMSVGGGWVLEVDIKGYFDTIDHVHLRNILDQRVRDGVLRRAIGKWLNAGVMADGNLHYPKTGTPQGGVVSPLLANAYLHEVLDVWFETVVKPRLAGRACLLRYADDFVIVFSCEADARKVMDVLPKRFGKYGLTLHPEKTRLVAFARPRPAGDRDDDGPGTFDLLGFTHFWAKSRKGAWVVKRKTARSRLRRAIRAVATWLRKNLHRKIGEQHASLVSKLRGHCEYYGGLIGNSRALQRYRDGMVRLWHWALGRRSQRSRMGWEAFRRRVLNRYPIPAARVSYPTHRRVAKAVP